jgi:hypothetical protein
MLLLLLLLLRPALSAEQGLLLHDTAAGGSNARPL